MDIIAHSRGLESTLFPYRIMIPSRVRIRLGKTSFCGHETAAAGNFLGWSSLNQFLTDEDVLASLERELAVRLSDYRTIQHKRFSLVITFPKNIPIGWARVLPRYLRTDGLATIKRVVDRREDRHTVASFVTDTALRAPLTNKVTIELEHGYFGPLYFWEKRQKPNHGRRRRRTPKGDILGLLDIYPGTPFPHGTEDHPIDITRSSGIILFNRLHPGEPHSQAAILPFPKQTEKPSAVNH